MKARRSGDEGNFRFACPPIFKLPHRWDIEAGFRLRSAVWPDIERLDVYNSKGLKIFDMALTNGAAADNKKPRKRSHFVSE